MITNPSIMFCWLFLFAVLFRKVTETARQTFLPHRSSARFAVYSFQSLVKLLKIKLSTISH